MPSEIELTRLGRHRSRTALQWTIIAAGCLCCTVTTWAAPIVRTDLRQLPPFSVQMVSTSSGKILQSSRVWVAPQPVDGQGDVVIRVSTPLAEGVTRQAETLLQPGPTLRCLREGHHIFNAQGETLAETVRQFRPDALPFAGLEVPTDTYPINESLLYLLAGLPFDEKGNATFHVLGLVEALQMDVWRHGVEEVRVPAGNFSCDHIRMRPNAESLRLPAMLRPLAKLFLPEFEAWIDRAEPHLAVRIKGPFGPPNDRDVVLEVVEIEQQPAAPQQPEE
ncbi:MAG TPA: hypothetical protein VMT89_14165 [Candidatus Acidoferrales bacterium]|nr:hypothetical protein [Candidatus Acidoferrales bacterium]